MCIGASDSSISSGSSDSGFFDKLSLLDNDCLNCLDRDDDFEVESIPDACTCGRHLYPATEISGCGGAVASSSKPCVCGSVDCNSNQENESDIDLESAPGDCGCRHHLVLEPASETSGCGSAVTSSSQPCGCGSAGTSSSNQVADAAILKRTKLCRFFIKGQCVRGESCTFAHGTTDLRAQPDWFRTQLCHDWHKSQSCAYGSKCKFAHSSSEVRPANNTKSKKKRNRKKTTASSNDKEQCKFQLEQLEVRAAEIKNQLIKMRSNDAKRCAELSVTSQRASIPEDDIASAELGTDANTDLRSDERAPHRGRSSTKDLVQRNYTLCVKNTFLDVVLAKSPPCIRGHSAPAGPRSTEPEASSSKDISEASTPPRMIRESRELPLSGD